MPVFAILAGLFFPDRGVSPNAEDIFTLYVLIFAMALVVFIGVQGSLIWFLLKFKARRGRVLQRPEFASIVAGIPMTSIIPATITRSRAMARGAPTVRATLRDQSSSGGHVPDQ